MDPFKVVLINNGQSTTNTDSCFRCKYCFYSSNNEVEVTMHVYKYHLSNLTTPQVNTELVDSNERRYLPGICTDNIKTPILEPHTCAECEFATNYAWSLMVNVRGREPVGKYTHEECPLTVSPAIDSKTQFPIRQTGNRKFVCDRRDYAALRSCNLRQHKLKHSGEKPFACGSCGFRTRQASNLRVHERRKHAFGGGIEYEHKCAVCPYGTSSSGVFAVHMLKHNGKPPGTW